jgi:hypothetical protein
MKMFVVKKIRTTLAILILACSIAMQQPAVATPFGQGDFGDSTFGSLTSLSMSFSGDVTMALAPNGGNFEGNGSHTVTITTNDANGYRLYLYSLNSGNLTIAGGGSTIAASGNSSPSTLAVNTWGYNTTGSTTNFQGMLTTPTEIKVTSEPYTSGDNTTVTYGAKTDITKPAGTYTGNVVYTAVARFDN